ncbi:four helix bundle protein [Aquirufa antheringensis]|uniref:four helix bundle protein n=1 Tax=Aquirufa antheringensis TaxID=2516559 RepID=UPI0022A8942F|nr:four helix bundle protein [Aquirufa antheringensis]
MMTENPALTKSFDFSLKMVSLCRKLIYEDKEFVLGKQLLRCSTSIGANLEEAIGGFSRNDFKYKISIAYKEARETHYWIRLLMRSKILSGEEGCTALKDLEELLKILTATLKTLNKA